MTKVGIIVRSDLTGLGVQSRNWVRLLDPHKVILIDSTPFNQNEQHPEWYEKYNPEVINGFIWEKDFNRVLSDIDVLLSFEIFYSYDLVAETRKRGIKTILQNNWEFTDYLQRPNLPLPDIMLNHSFWNLDKQNELWPKISGYCPTPIFVDDFRDNLRQNISRGGRRRFLHVAGRKTYKDRNGTQTLIDAVKRIPQDVAFSLDIKSQTAEFETIHDPRVYVNRESPEDEKKLYYDFDAMILPRRYGGASLPMTEALASGLPVIMTEIEPNSNVLPRPWLVPCQKVDSFMARTTIDVYEADVARLADRITYWAMMNEEDLMTYKLQAREIAIEQYSDKTVKEKWSLLLKSLGV